MRLSRYRDEQGFSLLEGMLAAVLLGTGLLAMSAMQGIAFVKNVDSNELTRITNLGVRHDGTYSVQPTERH